MEFLFPLEKDENPRERYGSTYAMNYATAKTKLFNARAKQLEEQR